MTTTVLLNADYTYLNVVNWKKAVCLITKGKAKALKYTRMVVRNFERTVVMRIPSVMILLKLVRVIYRNRVPFSRKNVAIRDGFKCAYCNTESKKLTIDHIVPKSRGGKTTFENCVYSCKKCNLRKGNKSCREAGMFPKVRAYQPTIYEFLMLKFKSSCVDELLEELGVI